MQMVMVLLVAWFMLAKDETARQNIAILYAVAFTLWVILWIF